MLDMHHEKLHGHHHWITVAFVLAALLLTLTEVHGQTTGASAMFEGRPTLSGAQGGLGAQAGMPQGGLGVQGDDAAARGLRLAKPAGLDSMGRAPAPASDVVVTNNTDMVLSRNGDLARKSDNAIAKDQRSVVKKTKRAAKRVVQRTRHGVSEFDTSRN